MASPAADPLPAVRAAPVAEVAWREADLTLRATGVLPLVEARGPVLALTYADVALAEALAAAPEALLTLTEARGAGAAYIPLLLRCRTRLVADPEGERFTASLLEQELLRWPPARLYADSVLLRREHWWWLPRLLVELDVEAVETFSGRSDAADHLLVVDPGTGLEARVATVRADPLAVRVHGEPPPAGEAVLLGQDLSFPDLERWGRWRWEGRWDGHDLRVRRSPGRIGLPPTPGVLTRVRRHRRLERACRQALATPPPSTPRRRRD